MKPTDPVLNIFGDGLRREFLQGVGRVLAGTLLPIQQLLAATYPVGDVRRYGVIPNRPEAATANASALKSIVDPAGTFSGKLYFSNTTGSDIYYFDDFVPFHDGTHLDLMGSTLTFTKTGSKGDMNTGFIHAIRDFSIQNGSIVVHYEYTAGANTGNALALGARASDCKLFPNYYDALLPAPMGNVVVRNIRISSNAGGGEGRAILILGGLIGVTLENISIDGQGKLIEGVYYEFGWATNEAKPYERRTSHARNFQVRNLTVSNVTGAGFAANGAYELTIDGIKVFGAGQVCVFGPGEAMYYRTWSGANYTVSTPHIFIRNVVGESISDAGIVVTGATKIKSSFLDNPPVHNNPNGLTVDHLTDLLNFTLDGFNIAGTDNNYGVSTSAGLAVMRNGILTGFQRGIVTSQECTRFFVEHVTVLNGASIGIQIGQTVSIHGSPRSANGLIRDCFLAGNGTADASPAIAVGTTQSCVIEGCRFGYEPAHDGRMETTQSQAVTVAADASGAICRYNYVGGTANNAVAYDLVGAQSATRLCLLEGNSGVVTSAGAWRTSLLGLGVPVVSDGGTIPTAGLHGTRVTAAAAVRGVALQPGTETGQTVTVIHEGAPPNSIAFDLPEASDVAGGHSEVIAGHMSRIFVWDNTARLWYALK